MTNKFKPIKIKGPSQGYCQICSKHGFLTYDHVPPKGASRLTSVEIRTLSQSIGATGKPAHSQNGVKFRTICDHCNNVKLGATHDPYLIEFCDQLSIYLRTVVTSKLDVVGHKGLFSAKPHRIAKAVVGHLLAGCIPEDYEQTPKTAPVPDALRKYFMNETEPFPENMDIYYWLYPSRSQVIINYFAYADIRYKEFIMASVLKFYPLAFLLVWDKPKSVEISHQRLLQEKNIGIDAVSTLTVDFNNIPPTNWPEAPGEFNYVLFDDSVTAVAHVKPKRNR